MKPYVDKKLLNKNNNATSQTATINIIDNN